MAETDWEGRTWASRSASGSDLWLRALLKSRAPVRRRGPIRSGRRWGPTSVQRSFQVHGRGAHRAGAGQLSPRRAPRAGAGCQCAPGAALSGLFEACRRGAAGAPVRRRALSRRRGAPAPRPCRAASADAAQGCCSAPGAAASRSSDARPGRVGGPLRSVTEDSPRVQRTCFGPRRRTDARVFNRARSRRSDPTRTSDSEARPSQRTRPRQRQLQVQASASAR